MAEASLTDATTVERVILAIRGVDEIPAEREIGPDTDLHAAGLSSLGAVRLLLTVEDEFGIELPDDLLDRGLFDSAQTLANAVDALMRHGSR